jgi:microcompartment protein CcmL/EutN
MPSNRLFNTFTLTLYCLILGGSVLAADAARKAADVRLIEVRLARGIGGKGYFTLTGGLPDVQAALDAGVKIIEDLGSMVRADIITHPHEDMKPFMI